LLKVVRSGNLGRLKVLSAAGSNLKALVNNAGLFLGGPLMHQPVAEVRKIFDVNDFGLLAVPQAFLPH
jgi:NADP-dependent 3-hydroxy acid dehydrogenase YdfG